MDTGFLDDKLEFNRQDGFLDDSITLAKRMCYHTGHRHILFLDTEGRYHIRNDKQDYFTNWEVVFDTESIPDERYLSK